MINLVSSIILLLGLQSQNIAFVDQSGIVIPYVNALDENGELIGLSDRAGILVISTRMLNKKLIVKKYGFDPAILILNSNRSRFIKLQSANTCASEYPYLSSIKKIENEKVYIEICGDSYFYPVIENEMFYFVNGKETLNNIELNKDEISRIHQLRDEELSKLCSGCGIVNMISIEIEKGH